ncbi:SufB/SufD family protein [Cardinium endosymbiont of Bemisia tabaci]|uniref:SufB/SufD family protein n=1 Tax=Cardinium endosymbiont of Bemisia tabaci TaxID=672794 RepID=UPI000442D312|nr:SufD family Fe-S cluster assembly protein [Cardinium endosymbiont of Bemisia tabaci]CDG49574.1 Iron-sulfur cluster assembly protein SufD [Cardinium endosymbiont cBtQ1 of Bemisia tabaci]
MKAFTNWLTDIFKKFSLTDPFYSERLWAFHRLNQPDFIASQREHYNNLGEIVELCIHQPYGYPISKQACSPVEVGGYTDVIQTVTLTFVDGIYADLHGLPQGVELHKLLDLPLLKQKEVLTAYMDDIRSSDDLFVLLNRMLSQESYLLEVTEDIQKVIVLQHIVTDSARHVVPQLMISLSQASKATIIENWYTLSHNPYALVNHFTHILLEERAHLSYHTLYTDSPSCYQVNSLYCNQKAHTTFTHHTFAFDTGMLRMHLKAQINGSHARTMLYGLSTLGVKEKVAHQIQVIHSEPHSFSQQHYKSILAGQSTGSFSGKIYLTPAAQQTNAYQTNNALILSDAARHYAKPQLEIYADDVKCSHGATTGQLDPAQLFYLQSRGIAAPLAKRLLLEAFGSTIIGSVSLPILQDYVYGKLVAKLVKL